MRGYHCLQYTGPFKKRGVPHASGLRVGVCIMPEGLKRYYDGPSAFPHVQLLSAAAAAQHDASAQRLRRGPGGKFVNATNSCSSICGHAQSRSSAHQRMRQGHAIRSPESVEATRLAGSPEKHAPRVGRAMELRIYRRRRESASLLAAQIL